MTELVLDIEGIEAISRRLRLIPKELEAATRKAAPRAGQRARATASRHMRQSGVGSSTIKRRVRGKGGRLWIGANPVTATLKLRAGRLEEGEFPLHVGGLPKNQRPIFRRVGKRRNDIAPVPFSLSGIATKARDLAEEAARERYLEVFESESEKAIVKASERQAKQVPGR